MWRSGRLDFELVKGEKSISHLGGEINLEFNGEVEAGGTLGVITVEIAFNQVDWMQLPRE